MFVVIGGCSCLLLSLWCVPWTLAMFWTTATTMVGSPCLTMAHLPIFDNTLQEGKKGAAGLGMADVCCDWHWQMPPGAFLVCSMVPSNVLRHCHNNGWLSLHHNSQFAKLCQHLSRDEKRGAVGLGMADVCCDWWFWLPSSAFVVCSMDPSNVWKHCHNNDWLSLSHNGPFANI